VRLFDSSSSSDLAMEATQHKAKGVLVLAIDSLIPTICGKMHVRMYSVCYLSLSASGCLGYLSLDRCQVPYRTTSKVAFIKKN
jgi:hypothetical protein